MFTKHGIMFLWAQTPLHLGSGDSVQSIDLPIQREVYTEIPIIQGQSLKGALREHLTSRAKALNNDNELAKIEQIFGSEKSEFAGALSISQARVLVFPLASLKGVFVYATCPLILMLFKRDLELAGVDFISLSPLLIEETHSLVSSLSSVTINSKLILSQFCFTAEESETAKNIAEGIAKLIFKSDDNLSYWKNLFISNFVILNDTVFKNLTKIKTEVVHRIRIDYSTGTVERGALWTEEYLPAETLLWCNLFSMAPLNKVENGLQSDSAVLDYIKENSKFLFIGGDQTVGKGLVRLFGHSKKEKENEG